MAGPSYITSNVDISKMSSSEVSEHIRELADNGQHKAAENAFNSWTANHVKSDVKRGVRMTASTRGAGEEDEPGDVIVETGQFSDTAGGTTVTEVVAQEALERAEVDEAMLYAKQSKRDFERGKSQNFAPDTKISKTPKGDANKPPETFTTKKAVDCSSESQKKQKNLEDLPKEKLNQLKGIGGDPLLCDPTPNFIKRDDDVVDDGAHNTSIVLGRDRHASRLSGYGGKGDTGAGAIDIVAGRMAYLAKSKVLPADPVGPPSAFAEDFSGAQAINPEMAEHGEKIWCNPDFVHDAARVYISQKADIDEYFNLAAGRVGLSKTRSAIGIKADAVRIVARDGIKLVTRSDRINSQGGDVVDISGIDLMSTNEDSDLQPIPKGGNLAEALQKLTDHVDSLNGIVDSLVQYQSHLNEKVTNHYHYAPAQVYTFPGGIVWKTTPSPPVVAAGIKTLVDHLSQTKRSLIIQKANLAKFKINYFTTPGDKYINSRYNNTT